MKPGASKFLELLRELGAAELTRAGVTRAQVTAIASVGMVAATAKGIPIRLGGAAISLDDAIGLCAESMAELMDEERTKKRTKRITNGTRR
jgi:hypothetical protein